MFFIKSCTVVKGHDICFNILFQTKREQKHRAPDTYYYVNNDYAMPTSNSAQNRQKAQKGQKNKKTSFPKESVENADFYKPILNKIIIAHE